MIQMVHLVIKLLICGIGLIFVYYALTGKDRFKSEQSDLRFSKPTRRRLAGVWFLAFAAHLLIVYIKAA